MLTQAVAKTITFPRYYLHSEFLRTHLEVEVQEKIKIVEDDVECNGSSFKRNTQQIPPFFLWWKFSFVLFGPSRANQLLYNFKSSEISDFEAWILYDKAILLLPLKLKEC